MIASDKYNRQLSGAMAGFGVTAAWLTDRLRKAGLPVVAATEIILALMIGVAAVSIVIGLLAPIPVAERLPTALGPAVVDNRPAATVDINPFRTAEVAATPVVDAAVQEYDETSLDLKLHGVYGAVAIIMTPDGEQDRYAIGDEITRGVVLDQVNRDHVVLLTGGRRETLRLINRDLPIAVTPLAAMDEETVTSSSGQLTDIIRAFPRPIGGKLQIVLEPGPDTARFAALGLKSGDIVVAVNGRRIGGDLTKEIEQFRTAASQKSVTLLVERDGRNLPVELSLTGQEDTDDE